jgi:hypothetical protein
LKKILHALHVFMVSSDDSSPQSEDFALTAAFWSRPIHPHASADTYSDRWPIAGPRSGGCATPLISSARKKRSPSHSSHLELKGGIVRWMIVIGVLQVLPLVIAPKTAVLPAVLLQLWTGLCCRRAALRTLRGEANGSGPRVSASRCLARCS